MVQTAYFFLVHIIYIAVIAPTIPFDSNLRILVTSLFACFVAFSASWISTIWIVWQYHKMRSRQRAHRATEDLSPSSSELEFEDVLSNKIAFDLFAVHLVNEFSIENLAFLLEAMQIKQDLVDNKMCCHNEVGLMVPMAPERMERTRRRKKSEGYTVQDLRESIKCLMHYYVLRSARCGINISSMTRDRIHKIFTKLEHQCDTEGVPESGPEITGTDGGVEGADRCEHVIAMRQHLDFFVNHNPNGNEPSQWEKELSVQYALLLDKALEEIICLLRSDCLTRFQASKAYSKLNSDANASCSSM